MVTANGLQIWPRLIGAVIALFAIYGLVIVIQGEGSPDVSKQDKILLKAAVSHICQSDLSSQISLASIDGLRGEEVAMTSRSRSGVPGMRAMTSRWAFPGNRQLIIDHTVVRDRTLRLRLSLVEHRTFPIEISRPLLALQLSQGCDIVSGRLIRYDYRGEPLSVETLLVSDFTVNPNGPSIPINPPVPNLPDRKGVLVAHIDSGVNYLLPKIASRLARDERGRILGFDYEDMDRRPYDRDSTQGPFYIRHHGTTTASLLLHEAPMARLVPYRFPRSDMARFKSLIADIVATDIRIVSMAMGSRSRKDWQHFEAAATRAKDTLFIVSAGNNGFDIDKHPIYPAALDLDNILVVTSSDPFGRLAPGSNYGRTHVDIATRAERVSVIDHRGALVRASGSSYAVPRIAALATRLLAENPTWSVQQLKAEITGRAVSGRRAIDAVTRHGWLPNPASIN